jgi:hypothetical protein
MQSGAMRVYHAKVWLRLLTTRSGARAAAIGLAWFAFAWAVVRACVQSVTGDEAESYMFFAARVDPSHWAAAANNHVLNSMLTRMCTTILGLSAFSIRLPALAGAAIYIYAVYALCQIISAEWKIRIPLFICLVYNPFIFDFFVASRGYGMANAFLMTAIAASAAWHLQDKHGEDKHGDENRGRALLACMAVSSASLALSFSANFSFAFADVTIGALLLAWAVKAVRKDTRDPALPWKVLAAGVLPGLIVVMLIPSWTLLHFPATQIVAGARSLRETLTSLVHASTYRPNPHLINPLLLPVFEVLSDFILPVTGALALVQLVWIFLERRRGEQTSHTKWLYVLGGLVGLTFVLTVLEHRLAYRLFHILLPVSRTGIFFLPLATLPVGIAAAIPAFSRSARVCRMALIGALCVLSGYYLFCLRLTYFEEWDYQADIKKAYQVVACYNHERNIQNVEVSWYYHAGMDFYRLVSGHETFGPFSSSIQHTTGHPMYILEGDFEKDFISAQGLKVVFKGDMTNLVVAVRPDLADEPGGACYVWPAP